MYRNKLYAAAAVVAMLVAASRTWLFSPLHPGMGRFVRAYVGVTYLVGIALTVALWRRSWPFAGRYLELRLLAAVASLGVAYVLIAVLIVISIT